MKHIHKITFTGFIAFATFLVFSSCNKNDVAYETVYSELYSIKLEGQIGDAVIDYDNQSIFAKIFSENYAAIELIELSVSMNANTSVNVGETIDFSNSDTQELTISAESGGGSKTYIITIEKFTSPPFVGEWTISSAYADRIRIHHLWTTSWWEENHVDAYDLVDSWWNPWGGRRILEL